MVRSPDGIHHSPTRADGRAFTWVRVEVKDKVIGVRDGLGACFRAAGLRVRARVSGRGQREGALVALAAYLRLSYHPPRYLRLKIEVAHRRNVAIFIPSARVAHKEEVAHLGRPPEENRREVDAVK